MKIYRKRHQSVGILAMFIMCYLFLPSVSAGELSGTEWKVTRGDTLYSIARSVFPGDTSQQARLRRDIIKLNPSVFADGANNMSVGAVLTLPDYAAQTTAPSTMGEPAQTPMQHKMTPKFEMPSVSAGEFSGTEWKVKRGDTLYAISRSVFPGDTLMQERLRQDIIKLNPSVFANGANNMSVGVVLTLPDYAIQETAPSAMAEPAPAPMAEPMPEPVPEKVTPEPVPVPVSPPPVAESQPKTPMVEEQPAPSVSQAEQPVPPPSKAEQPAPSPSQTDSGVVLSLGYSSGGDKLINVAGGPSINAGTGLQLRLGYEQIFQKGHGYRMSLGLQYYTLLEDRDVSLRDTYLQLAYQYRAKPVLYGIGVVVDAGTKVENNNNTAEFDPAVGGIVYLENVGDGILSGWGLSATYLKIEEKVTHTSFNASRAEIYYSWRF